MEYIVQGTPHAGGAEVSVRHLWG